MMKKLVLVLGVIALIFSASSCNKQKKCQCTYKLGNISVDTDVFLSDEGKDCSDYEATFNYSEIECHRVY